MSEVKPVKVAVVGCGAIAEHFYARILQELEASGEAKVVSLTDPSAARRAALRAMLPGAGETESIEQALEQRPDLAIVASPPRFHAAQTLFFLERKVAVLCEKPMSATLSEAEEMARASERTGTPLAVGLFRRFYPTSETVRALVREQTFGRVLRIDVTEGGPFNWPAASASFFRKAESQGGVLADLGAHVLDLLIWWFGYPEEFRYEDDAMGGLEANCVVELRFAGGVEGRVRLSRDTKVQNGYALRAERGVIRWQAGTPNKLEVEGPGGWTWESQLKSAVGIWKSPDYHESFARQLVDVLDCLRTGRAMRVPGPEGVLSLRLIEACYRSRKLMAMPWLSAAETKRARELAGV